MKRLEWLMAALFAVTCSSFSAGVYRFFSAAAECSPRIMWDQPKGLYWVQMPLCGGGVVITSVGTLEEASKAGCVATDWGSDAYNANPSRVVE